VLKLSPLPRTLDAACRDAGHRKVSVRLSAIADLATLAGQGKRTAADLLRALLRDDPAPAVRGEAALGLADAGAVAALPDLLEASDEAHLRVRQMAVVALGELGGQLDAADPVRGAVVRRLQGLLDAPEPELRFQSLIGWVRVVGALDDDVLGRSFADPDGEVRHVALRLAEERWLSRDPFPEEARRLCRSGLGDPDLRVRVLAAVILGRAGDDAGSAVLVEAVAARTGGDPEDTEQAIQLVGELGIREAARPLALRAFGGMPFPTDPFAWQARIALARLGDARARASILRGLTAWTRETRSLSAVAAGRAGLEEARPVLEAMARDARRAEPSAVAEALETLGTQKAPAGSSEP
jgi:HEAT repeat protein